MNYWVKYYSRCWFQTKWSTVVRFPFMNSAKKEKKRPKFSAWCTKEWSQTCLFVFTGSPSVTTGWASLSLAHDTNPYNFVISSGNSSSREVYSRCGGSCMLFVDTGIAWLCGWQSPIQRGTGFFPLHHLWPALLYCLLVWAIKAFELFEFSNDRRTFCYCNSFLGVRAQTPLVFLHSCFFFWGGGGE